VRATVKETKERLLYYSNTTDYKIQTAYPHATAVGGESVIGAANRGSEGWPRIKKGNQTS